MRIELDTVAYDSTTVTTDYVNAAVTGQAIVQDYPGVTFRIVTEHGPAGGNPILAFRGPKEQIVEMIAKHYGEDTLEEYCLNVPV